MKEVTVYLEIAERGESAEILIKKERPRKRKTIFSPNAH